MKLNIDARGTNFVGADQDEKLSITNIDVGEKNKFKNRPPYGATVMNTLCGASDAYIHDAEVENEDDYGFDFEDDTM